MAPDGVRVAVEHGATPEECAGVAEVLRRYGLEGKVEPAVRFRGGESLWVVAVAAGAAGAFFQGIASAAGTDAYEALKRFLAELWDRRDSRRAGHVEIRFEHEDGLILVVGGPPAAGSASPPVDLLALPSGELRWSAAKGDWEFTPAREALFDDGAPAPHPPRRRGA